MVSRCSFLILTFRVPQKYAPDLEGGTVLIVDGSHISGDLAQSIGEMMLTDEMLVEAEIDDNSVNVLKIIYDGR